MAERKTKEFGEADQGKTFSLVNLEEEAKSFEESKEENGVAEILMEIEDEKKPKRIKLRKDLNFETFSGNFVKDYFKIANDWLISKSKIKITQLATFFRLLSVMINSGLPLIRSLDTLANQSEKTPKLSKALRSMARKIETGESFSKAMMDYPDIFSEAQIGAIKAGEASGQLNKTLKDLAEEAEKTASIVSKVRGAMIYPIMILIILFVVVFIMMTMVVPQITSIYTDSGNKLPWITEVLIQVSNFFINYWLIMILIIIGGLIGFIWWKRTKNGKYLWDLFLISVPVFGDLMKKAVLAKFAHSFGNLLASGVPIIKAIEIVSTAVGNEVYKKRLILTAEDMKSGIPMAENMNFSKLFPSMLVNMLEIGEQTAQLEGVTSKIASFYDDEVSNAVAGLTKIMEPLILVFVGVVVGGIVGAIMLPIINLTNSVN